MKIIKSQIIKYTSAMQTMDQTIQNIRENKEEECIWFLEHNHVYTIGSNGYKYPISENKNVEIIQTSRGGSIMYHGPGQRIIYFMCKMESIGDNISEVVHKIQIIIKQSCEKVTGKMFDIKHQGPGIWLISPDGYKKIGFIGLRVTKDNYLYHGIAINNHTDLSYFQEINTCGYENNIIGNLNTDQSLLDQELEKNFLNI